MNVFKGLISFLILASGYTQLQAAEYYVSMTGSDSNIGSQASPWRTVSHAANVAVAGDTVIIAAGTYIEDLNFSKAASSSSPITFIGTRDPVIAGHLFFSGSYYIVSGLTCSPTTISYGDQAISLAGHHNTCTRCTITNYADSTTVDVAPNQATGCKFGGGFNTFTKGSIHDLNDISAFIVFGNNQVISNNTVYDIGQVHYSENHTDFVKTWGFNGMTSYNIVISGNLVRNCTCQLGNTETDGSSEIYGWTFENNIFYRIDNSFFAGLPRTYFYNNLFYNVGVNQGVAIYVFSNSVQHSDGDRFINNIFLGDVAGILSSTANYSGNGIGGTAPAVFGAVTNNYFGTATFGAVTNEQFKGMNFINGGNPNFVSMRDLDFHPKPHSVLIGAGVPISGLNVDKDGVIRPRLAWCIGPYEASSTNHLQRVYLRTR